MDELIIVTHPEPVLIEVRPLDLEEPPEGNVALAYYYDGHLLARGFVASEAVSAIHGILSNPVSVALAATEDKSGNIDARFCLVLPVDSDKFGTVDEEAGPEEAWRTSLPTVPSFSSTYDEADEGGASDEVEDEDEDEDEDDDERARVALLPIGNVVRNAQERRHPDDVARDLHEMLLNLMNGRAKDAVAKAIDDLLSSL
jgi:hypothetical protein